MNDAYERAYDDRRMIMAELLNCQVLCTWYAVVCCMCKKTLELKHTEEKHLLMETSHTYCETCQEIVMKEIG